MNIEIKNSELNWKEVTRTSGDFVIAKHESGDYTVYKYTRPNQQFLTVIGAGLTREEVDCKVAPLHF